MKLITVGDEVHELGHMITTKGYRSAGAIEIIMEPGVSYHYDGPDADDARRQLREALDAQRPAVAEARVSIPGPDDSAGTLSPPTTERQSRARRPAGG